MPARWSRTHSSAKILSMKRSSRVSFVSQRKTSLSECAVTGSMFGGAFISCFRAVTWIDGLEYVVSPLDEIDLCLTPAFDGAQHRRRVLRVPLLERLFPRSHEGLAGRVTVGGGDGGTIFKLLEEKLAAVGRADNLADIRPHQTGHCGSGR